MIEWSWRQFLNEDWSEKTDKELIDACYDHVVHLDSMFVGILIWKKLKSLTESINKSSESSDRLSKIWLWLTLAIVFLWIVEISIKIIPLLLK